MPRWLEPEEQDAWRAYLRGSARLTERLDRDLQERHGISLADYEILVILSEADERRLRMTELADTALFSKSRISHAIARLERTALVRRESCPDDRRGIFAVLTEEGYRKLAEAARTHVAGVRTYLVDAVAPEDLQAIGRTFFAVDRRLCDSTGETRET